MIGDYSIYAIVFFVVTVGVPVVYTLWAMWDAWRRRRRASRPRRRAKTQHGTYIMDDPDSRRRREALQGDWNWPKDTLA